MKRALQICLILTLVFSLAAPALAASSRKGKKIFKSNCGSCHTANGEGGKLSPLMKTQAQWRIYFSNEQHQDKPEIWQGMSVKQQKDLLKFFLDFALDSDQPETCG
jgi:mono/diheme cytochrome c family protein